MRSGKLNRRIRIEQRSTVRDAMGGFTDSWSTVATVWASIRPQSATERTGSGTTIDIVTTVFEIRYRSGLTPAMRIIDLRESQVYDIRSIIEKSYSKRMLDITATLTNSESSA